MWSSFNYLYIVIFSCSYILLLSWIGVYRLTLSSSICCLSVSSRYFLASALDTRGWSVFVLGFLVAVNEFDPYIVLLWRVWILLWAALFLLTLIISVFGLPSSLGEYSLWLSGELRSKWPRKLCLHASSTFTRHSLASARFRNFSYASYYFAWTMLSSWVFILPNFESFTIVPVWLYTLIDWIMLLSCKP